ncbi:MAG: zinc-dependent metalloprotease [Solirubrobacterales bacterium]
MNAEAQQKVIDWGLAERIARTLAGNGSGKRSVRQGDLRRAARGSVGVVRGYTGLEPKGRLPAAEVVDRREWIGANIDSLRSMSGGVEESLAASLDFPRPIGPGLRVAAGAAAGVELGLVSAFMAQRVLGQYDVGLIGPARPPRLMFVAPNLAEAQRRLGAERDPFLRWVALHEATHVVQFGAVPWLRRHLGGLAEELLSGAFASVSTSELTRIARRLLNPDPRRMAAALRKGEWRSPFIGRRRARLLGNLQATMTVVEGYSEHVMDAVIADLDQPFGELRDRMERGRDQRGLLETLLSRLLGLDMKLRQYRLGKSFCDEVAERRGIETLNRVWSEPATLPRPSELEQPGRWLARVA